MVTNRLNILQIPDIGHLAFYQFENDTKQMMD